MFRGFEPKTLWFLPEHSFYWWLEIKCSGFKSQVVPEFRLLFFPHTYMYSLLTFTRPYSHAHAIVFHLSMYCHYYREVCAK